MHIEQLYTNCLAQAAYYIQSGNEAVVIDPLRDPEPYLHLAEQKGATLKYILETHFHADFVSGHLDLANLSGAEIVFGPDAQPHYPAYVATDGEELKVGKVTIKVLHTPGHTIESACYLLMDEEGKPHALFSGDTLFIGDVGRPDLLSGNLTKETLAGMLYDSLQNKIKTLPDDVVVYPGHGAGSACGKKMSKETQSTIGMQKQLNYAMQDMPKAQFIALITDGLTIPPAYFFKDAGINVKGYRSHKEVIEEAYKPLNFVQFHEAIASGALILDTRDAENFAEGHITNSINIGLNGQYAVWAGTVIPFDTPLVLVTEAEKELESITRLVRIGYENIVGYLDGGYPVYELINADIDSLPDITPQDALDMVRTSHYSILDVRSADEHAQDAIPGSINIPLGELSNNLHALNPDENYIVHCAGGYRSMIACSILRRNGFRNVSNVKGGMARIKKETPEWIARAGSM